MYFMYLLYYRRLLNFVVEWLALLLRIREVPASNLGSETGYPDYGFSLFSSVPQGNSGISL
jgi:hypothetical protein